MPTEKTKSIDTVAAGFVAKTGASERGGAGGVFTVTCFDKDGNLKWEEQNHNLVVNEGLQSMVSVYLDAATQITTWYIGLITGPAASTSFNAGDTLATHAGWTEDTNYSGNRKTAVFGTATTADPSVINNSGSPAQFSMTGTTTIAGAFLCSVDTGTSGVLFSASDFQAPGDRSVVSGDTLNVTYSFSLDAA